jgi:hypothetical protein
MSFYIHVEISTNIACSLLMFRVGEKPSAMAGRCKVNEQSRAADDEVICLGLRGANKSVWGCVGLTHLFGVAWG